MQNMAPALHDLDMDRLLCRVDEKMKTDEAVRFCEKYLTWDAEEIEKRGELLLQLKAIATANEVYEIADALDGLSVEALKEEQSGDALHTVVYRMRRVRKYIHVIDTFRRWDEQLQSERFHAMVRVLPNITSVKAHYDQLCTLIKLPKTMLLAANLNAAAAVTEFGLLDTADQAPVNSLIAPKDPSSEANALFEPMSYSRTQFGTHFDEYLGALLTKQMQPQLKKAAEPMKQLTLPMEDELASLADDIRFYALGLRFAETFEALCVAQTLPMRSENTLEAKQMVYPELALRAGVTANDASIGKDDVVLITGANHSGKTSFLKTVGQNLLLAQLGYLAMADALALCPARRVFTLFSAGEDQSMIASRMGLEARILADIMATADAGDLVLINEPLTSTNPYEAVGICVDLMRQLMEKHVPTVIVTHLYDVYYEMKSDDPRFRSMVTRACFDPAENQMQYDYTLTESEPLGNSYARETADAYGITLENLIADDARRSAAADFCHTKEGGAK